MPRDQRRRQEKLLKKRRKEKVKKKRTHVSGAGGMDRTLLRSARKYPILECFLNENWREDLIARIVVARAQTEHLVLYGVYLVDLGCLGVKDAFWRGNATHSDYAEFKDRFRRSNQGFTTCSSSLAHQIIYGARDYAKAIGFEPHRDFAQAQLVLEPRDAITFDAHIEFGKDGKPFYVSGPHDNVNRIMNHLEKTLGPGNYHFLAHVMTGELETGMDDELGSASG
ncbi:MAG: hypothetical protein KA184_20920 [Candidatus Hydrogenedentes bacterium]|nr:hypothetical protein [Candidatus Hydrogenedentota bacterium]